MLSSITIEKFIELMKSHPVIDVRSPAEFEEGHIPSAYNIPLMDNVERAIIGTIFKHSGKQSAILKGFDFAGPKLREYIKQLKKITKENVILIHCWRGGMRSNFLAWLFSFYGYEVFVLEGGYKSFRKWTRQQFEAPQQLIVLGGNTGSAKTEILQSLNRKGEQIIDLENLANHKGSAYGGIAQTHFPTQEMFENNLALNIHQLNPEEIIWIEDEGRTIGNKVIPELLWKKMRAANCFILEIPFEERLTYITTNYGELDIEELIAATTRIKKRLGNDNFKFTVEAFRNNNLRTAFNLVLQYYDGAYQYNLSKKEHGIRYDITCEKIDVELISAELIKLKNDNG